MTTSQNVTGRDSLVMQKALAYAIVAIERLPTQWQELSDKEDMRLLLNHLAGEKAAELFLTMARGNLERRGFKVGEEELKLADYDSKIVEGVFPEQDK